MTKRLESGFLIIIFLVSLIFRLVGIRWGLPYPYDHDGFFIVSHAVKFFEGNFNPGWFIYPSFHMYFLFLIYGILFRIGHFTGYFGSVQEFRVLLDINPSIFIVTARAVAAIFSSCSVILSYILARKLFNRKAAFLTLLFAILPMEILNAHYCTSDVPLVFWFLISFIFCAEILKKPDIKNYIFAGIFAGIAGGAKYPGLGAVLPITIAHLIRLGGEEKKWRAVISPRRHHKLLISLIITGIVFFALTPFVFLDYKHSLPNIIGEFKIRYTELFDIYQRLNESRLSVYLKAAFLNFGVIFTSLGLIGFFMRLKRVSRQEVLLLSWIIPFAFIIHTSKLKPLRYFLTLSPFLVILFSNAIIDLVERVKKKTSFIRQLSIVIAFFIFLQPLYFSIKNDIILIKLDTREKAYEWIMENIPEGTVIANELLWTPFLPKGRYNIIYGGWSLGDREMEWYKERKAQYFLVSQNMKDLMSHPDRPSPLHRKFYKDLEGEADLIHEAVPKDKGLFMEFHNPAVLIYKTK